MSLDFYSLLFGWEAPADELSDLLPGFQRVRLGSAVVAGFIPPMPPATEPVANWSVCIAVENTDSLASAIVAKGGKVLSAPHDVLDLGREAVFQDPEGAVFGVWEANEFRGADLLDATGALCGIELRTEDPGDAATFYGELFGWRTVSRRQDGPALWRLGDRDIGRTSPALDQGDAQWTPVFGVEDVGHAIDKIESLGGSTSRVDDSVILASDPLGGTFALAEKHNRPLPTRPATA